MKYLVRELPVSRKGETGMEYTHRLEAWLNARTPLELVGITRQGHAIFVDRRAVKWEGDQT